MKKKLLLILFGLCSLFLFTGCHNSKNIKAVCRKTDEYEKENVESVYTMYFDENKILKKMHTLIVEKDMDQDTYDGKKKLYNESSDDPDFKDTDYQFDDKNRKITVETMVNYSFTEADKDQYEAGTYIKTYEDMSYTCKIEGISRKKLGLK